MADREGKRSRTVVTRFGEVEVERRLMRDEEGRARFLLDETMGLPPREVATPGIQEAALGLVTEVGFARAAELIEALTAGVLSASTVWRIAQRARAWQRAQEAEEARRVYKEGKPMSRPRKEKASRLYIEADGIWVPLQREK